MAINQDKYTEQKVNRIYQILQNAQQQGQMQDYEIQVDGLKVVQRTDDLEMFFSHEDFIDADTKSLSIAIYSGASNRNDRHILWLKEEPKEALNGLEDIDTRVEKRIQEAEDKWKYQQLNKEHEQLKTDYAELEKFAEQIEKDLAESKTAKFKFGNMNIGELGSVMLEGIVRRNPQILTKLPMGDSLAGVFEEDAKAQTEPSNETEEEVSFKKKTSSETGLSTEDQALLDFGKQLQSRFTQEEILLIMQILDYLAQDKEQIKITLGKLIASETVGTNYNEKPE